MLYGQHPRSGLYRRFMAWVYCRPTYGPEGMDSFWGLVYYKYHCICGFFYKAWSNMALVRFGKEKKRKTKNETKIPKPLCSKTVIAV